jgi:hypothetical protein
MTLSRGFRSPPHLEESHRGVVGALQAGTCDKGDVLFSNVPAGKYYFVMAVQRAFRWYSSPSSDYAFVNGPEGIMAITVGWRARSASQVEEFGLFVAA